jgi:hypothetical protein
MANMNKLTSEAGETATPRTDNTVLLSGGNVIGLPERTHWVPADFARTLERELAEAKAANLVHAEANARLILRCNAAEQKLAECQGEREAIKEGAARYERSANNEALARQRADSTRADLKAKLAAVEGDARRLEWLRQAYAYFCYSRDGEICWLKWPYGRDNETEACEPETSTGFNDFRKCIDAEMATALTKAADGGGEK